MAAALPIIVDPSDPFNNFMSLVARHQDTISGAIVVDARNVKALSSMLKCRPAPFKVQPNLWGRRYCDRTLTCPYCRYRAATSIQKRGILNPDEDVRRSHITYRCRDLTEIAAARKKISHKLSRIRPPKETETYRNIMVCDDAEKPYAVTLSILAGKNCRSLIGSKSGMKIDTMSYQAAFEESFKYSHNIHLAGAEVFAELARVSRFRMS